MDAVKEKVIGNIRAIRETKNYSEEYMAEKMGIGQSTYNRKENGEGDFTLTELIKVINQYHNQDQSGYIEHQTVVSDEGYKAALEQYKAENEYLKRQNDALLSAMMVEKNKGA
jgi:transcriptional regulator with XRE-family HTH domain